MFKRGDTAAPDRLPVDAERVLIWVGRILVLLCVAVSLLVAALRMVGSGSYVGYLASRGTVFEVWGALSVLEVLFTLTAILGVGVALARRKLMLALLFSVLAWPLGFVIEGGRCDTAPSCRMMGWAALPSGAGGWSVRIRPVTDQNEAEGIASEALFKAGSDHGAYNARRFGDHWIVATIDDDGWPGRRAVKIDTRTGATRLVPCPTDRMLCGMERPVVSLSRQVFSNGRWGLAMTFPAGRAVCTARPDNDARSFEARGFYAMIRDADIPCDIVDPSRTLGLEALTARTVAEACLEPCKPLSPAILRAFGGRAPGFVGHPSVACEEIVDGQIAVSVFAFAGPRPESGATPTTLYEAWMLTDPAHLAEDARSFEAFLSTARIGAPAPS